MPDRPVVVVAAVVLLAVAAAVLRLWLVRRQRRAAPPPATAAYAASRGLTYVGSGEAVRGGPWLDLYAGQARHVVTGTDARGRELTCFENTKGDGRVVLVCALELPARSPLITVTPRGEPADFLARVLRARSVPIDDAYFTERFSVASTDVVRARAVLGPELVAELAKRDAPVSLRVHGDRVVAEQPPAEDPEEVAATVELLGRVADRL